MDNSDHEGSTMFIKIANKAISLCYCTFIVMFKQGVVGDLLQYAAGFFVP